MSESESDDEYLKCPCKECGNNIEFPASRARATVTCPHCGEWTELGAPEEPEEAGEPKVTVNLAALVLWLAVPLLVIGGIIFFVHRQGSPPEKVVAVKPVAPPVVKPAPPPPPTNPVPVVVAPAKPRPKSYEDLKLSEVTLEKAKEGKLLYAVGTVTNDSDYQRFSVRVELDLISLQGAKIGTAKDYLAILEPHKEWHFRGLVAEPKAVAARVALLKEEN